MHTDDFDYDLPTGLIAQHPAHPRDACRLLVLDRASGQVDHTTFASLPDYLRAGDLLVVNETRVLPARLRAVKQDTGGEAEVLLLRERSDDFWECLVRPGRRVKPGAHLSFADGAMTGHVVDVIHESGARLVQFHVHDDTSFLDVVHRVGQMPLPPYITEPLDDPEEYQTVFSSDERSAAAPTAGLHFTPELLEACRAAGARIETIELDVGLDTFRPVSEDDPREHVMHSEHFRMPQRTAAAIESTRAEGGRVIAIGTTSVRALESAAIPETRTVTAYEGATSLFILPGDSFHVVDALVTNFHVPRSTLLMMISAFAGRDAVMRAYHEAVERKYRFLSFGDAMLIV